MVNLLAMMALDIQPGDEIITTPFTFISTAETVALMHAKPVFADIELDTFNIDANKIEALITNKTKAIMPVHLTGRVCDMAPIMEIADKYRLSVVEDAAQAIGSKYKGKLSGSIGHGGCFSTHPLKNLNACGDGGFMTTNDEKIYLKARAIRNHGMANRNNVSQFGYVSRMDNLQAAILNYRLQRLDVIIEKRRKNAQLYFDGINTSEVRLPLEKKHEFNTYHTFVIQVDQRDDLRTYLKDNNIDEVRKKMQTISKKLGRPAKILVGKPGLDGHSNGAEQIAVRARDVGMEVIYHGIRLTPEEIMSTIEQENVDLVGLSILSGSHLSIVPRIITMMRERGFGATPLIVGGIVPEEDHESLRNFGVRAIYTPKDYSLNKIMLDLGRIIEEGITII